MLNETAQVLSFPKEKIVREACAQKIFDDMAKRGAQVVSEDIVQDLASDIMMSMENWGIDTNCEVFHTDFEYLVAILMATVQRTMNIEHPLHKLIDEYKKEPNEDDE